MSNSVPQLSSGSEADAGGMTMDEKKRKRMLSNRESARRSRMKKQKLLEDMVNEIARLKVDIGKNTDKFEVLMQRTVDLESENNVLMAQQMELGQYLRNLELMQTHTEQLLQMNLKLKQPAVSFSDQSVDFKDKEPHAESWQSLNFVQS